MTFLFRLAAATLLITILAALDLFRGNRTIDALRDVAPDPGPAALQVIHFAELPDGWPGKNHELWGMMVSG